MPLAGPEDELLKLLDALAFCAEPAFAINERHRIIFWNKAIEQILGWSYDEVAGKSCSRVLGGDDSYGNRYCSEYCPIVSFAQRGDAVQHFGLSVRTTDGHLPVDITVLRFVLKSTKGVVLVHRVQSARDAAMLVPPRPVDGYTDARVRELTSREIEVLGMLASGKNANDVAIHLGISPLTARNHIQHIFEKLEVHSKAEAVAFAFKMRVVS
jgi:DNA-binding CsgD family transcriptional regulator